MTVTATASTSFTRAHRLSGRRSPNISSDPIWIDESTFTLSEIRRARERKAPNRRRG
jgi:hypothetical protein